MIQSGVRSIRPFRNKLRTVKAYDVQAGTEHMCMCDTGWSAIAFRTIYTEKHRILCIHSGVQLTRFREGCGDCPGSPQGRLQVRCHRHETLPVPTIWSFEYNLRNFVTFLVTLVNQMYFFSFPFAICMESQQSMYKSKRVSALVLLNSLLK